MKKIRSTYKKRNQMKLQAKKTEGRARKKIRRTCKKKNQNLQEKNQKNL